MSKCCRIRVELNRNQWDIVLEPKVFSDLFRVNALYWCRPSVSESKAHSSRSKALIGGIQTVCLLCAFVERSRKVVYNALQISSICKAAFIFKEVKLLTSIIRECKSSKYMIKTMTSMTPSPSLIHYTSSVQIEPQWPSLCVYVTKHYIS